MGRWRLIHDPAKRIPEYPVGQTAPVDQRRAAHHGAALTAPVGCRPHEQRSSVGNRASAAAAPR